MNIIMTNPDGKIPSCTAYLGGVLLLAHTAWLSHFGALALVPVMIHGTSLSRSIKNGNIIGDTIIYIIIYILFHSHLNHYYNLMMVDTTVYDISTIIGIYIIRIKDVNITSNYNLTIMVDLPIIGIFHMSTIIHIFHPDHTPKGA